ncbi:MAG: helix-turn-helix domain-containing protein [Nocardioidaceae bacterium]
MPKSKGQQPQAGSQTLARGLRALIAVVDSADGMTVQGMANELGVHRTIAYRLLQTLASFGFVTQGSDGVYRPGARLAALADTYLPALREAAFPSMRKVADEVGCTVSLYVAEPDAAVSIALVEPTPETFHVRFPVGMRTPIDRGAAAYALLAAGPALPGEPDAVAKARSRGYATSHGEIIEGAYAVAAPIIGASPRSCLNLITYREDQAKSAEKHILHAAEMISKALLTPHPMKESEIV